MKGTIGMIRQYPQRVALPLLLSAAVALGFPGLAQGEDECDAPKVCISVVLPPEDLVHMPEGIEVRRILELPGRQVDYKVVLAEEPPQYVLIILYYVDSQERTDYVWDSGCLRIRNHTKTKTYDFEQVLAKKTHRKSGKLLLVAVAVEEQACDEAFEVAFPTLTELSSRPGEEQCAELLVKWRPE